MILLMHDLRCWRWGATLNLQVALRAGSSGEGKGDIALYRIQRYSNSRVVDFIKQESTCAHGQVDMR